MSDHRFEQRGLLHARVQVAQHDIHVIVVHLGLVPASRVRQVAQLRAYIEREIDPAALLVVAGDFNDWGTRVQRAMHAMDKKLAAAWALRQPTSEAKTPEQALILASIVEKETGRASDRAQIAGVFVNRLRVGMLLQTDPTVIYGLGDKFDGNLRKRDLQTDTPWNTYTRAGLPPTPIAMPGKAALMATVQPSQTKALYFVARGDGTSHFSASLDEHNRAVNRYQRGQQKP